MAIYRVTAPDGHTYRIEGPENASEADVIRAVQAQYPYAQYNTEELKKQPGAPTTLGDIGRSGLASLAGSAGAIASAFGAESAPAKGLRSFAADVQAGMSPARLEEMRRREELMKRGEEQGIGSEIMSGLGAVGEAPVQSVVSGLASSVPAIAAGSAILLAGAPVAIAGTVAMITKLAVGALQGAGETKGNIFDTVTQKLMEEKGMSRAEAEAQAIKAQEYISQNAPGIMGGAAAGMLDAVTGVESILGKTAKAKQATRPLTQPGALRTAGRAGLEEAIPEGIQAGVGQVAENVALQNAGFDTSTFSGVAGAAARDALMGALTGTAVSPLQHSQLRKEFEAEKQRKLDEEQQKLDAEIRKEEEALRQQQEAKAAETRAKEEEILAAAPVQLPSPVNVHPIRNPLGNVAKEELPEGAAEAIDAYRAKVGLPALNSYSIEDYVDAMPGINPQQEQKILDDILTQRTGYQGEQLTAKDVMDQAEAKQIHEDEALGDFLARTTGQKDLKSMSQPQLYAAFKAIQSLPEGEPLEAGTNAMRFTPQQYNTAIKGLDKIVSEEPVLVGDALKDIKLSTGLVEDAYAKSILDEAVRRGDIDRRGDKITAPTTAESLPEGYSIQEGEFERGERPEGFQIQMGEEVMPEVYDSEEAANTRAEEVRKVQGQMVRDINNQITQRQNDLEKAQENLTRMQAAGQQGSLAYDKANAKLVRLQRSTADNINRLNEQLARLDPEANPVSVVTPKARKVKGRGFTLFKNNEAVKFFKTRQEAEDAILGGMEEKDLQELIKVKGRRTLAPRAQKEIERRAQPKPEPKAKPEPKPEFEPTLRALLDRFGLKDVALNIEKDMKADGDYSKSVIRVALDSANPVRTLRHESIHALKELGFFKPNQWKALENMAKRQWINTYLKRRNINGEPLEAGQQSRYDAYMNVYNGDQDAIIEEAIADAFGDFDQTRAPIGMVRAILKRLKLFFEALRNALNGAGFLTYEDVFGKIEKGQLKEQRYEEPREPIVRPSTRGEERATEPPAGGRVERGRGEEGGGIAPLEGAPNVQGATGPDPRLVAVAKAYAKKAGIPYRRQSKYVEVTEDRAKRIAQAYEEMRHDPKNPEVKEAYRDLIQQTKDQYQALVDAGYAFTFFDSETDPYDGNPFNAMRDLRNNKRMAVYGTYDGYGTEGITGAAIEDNPLLEDTGLRWEDQNGVKHMVTANDLFRAVHDAFGHGLEGAGFRDRGEENAWQAHARLFKGPALGALTTETRGQNSWLNFGPYGEKNRTAKIEDTVFAEQKVGLMPDWTWAEGLTNDEEGIVLGVKQPKASTFDGVHYGKTQVDTLDASKYGTGLRGAERSRLDQSKDDRIKRRAYFYIQRNDGTMPQPEAGVGNFVYTQRFDNILGPGPELRRIFESANGDSNAFESAVVDAGYDGYALPNMGMMVILNHNVPVNYQGTKAQQPKLSLRDNTDPAIRDAVDRITTAREEKGFIQRMMDAISPESVSSFRAKALNRYDRLADYDKELLRQMGGAKLMADSSAEAAALMSDLGAGLTASALGVHDRAGGIPVYKNGVTTITNLNNTVKGPVAIFAPLAKYGDPYVYQLYQFWAGAKRGKRLMQDGREKVYTQAELNYAKKLEQQYPEFDQIQKEWIKFNNGLVQFLVDTGVLSKDKAQEFTRYSDYVPFYRQFDGERTIGPNLFASISGVKGPKKLKGGEAPLADFLETIVRNTQSSIQMGIKNVAAQRAADIAVKIGQAERLNYVSSGPDVFTTIEDGKLTHYQSYDPLFIDAIKSLNLPDLPFIGLLAGPANVLRNLVTKDPGFMLANMVRDSMSAYVTSGANMKPVLSTVGNFGKAIAGSSPEFEKLLNAGLIGGYEFSQNVKQSGKTLEEALRIKAGIKNKMDYVTGVWQALEKGTTASDAATRMEVYKTTLAETGNEAEALFRAMEVMNFNRKGSSAVVRVLTAGVPFLNARMQGLDVLYRAAFGKMGGDPAKVQRAFFVRGMTMFALSCMYWALTHDDDEYKKQEQETRDNYWLVPSMGVKIPIPFEVGILFKVIPERIMGVTFGDDTGKDFARSMGRQLATTLAFNPIPQTALPIIETVTNHSFFTGRDIVPQGLKDVAPEYQIGPGTSLFAQWIGQMAGLSPIQIDHLFKGYTGTMGMYAVDTLDMIMDLNGNSPKVSKRVDQLPIIKRFALDPEARGTVTAYYDLKNSVDEVTRTINLLERTGQYEDMGKYMQDNMQMLAVKDYIQDLEKQMKELREMRTLIRSSQMTGDQKRDAITDITKMENQLTSNIQSLKKLVAK